MRRYIINTRQNMKNLYQKHNTESLLDLYEVSTTGDIFTKEKRVAGGNNIRTLRRRKIKTKPNNKGYYMVNLHKDNRYKTFLVHRLVYEKHKGVIPTGFVVHHLNGNRKDNRIKNLSCIKNEVHSSIENSVLGEDVGRYIQWVYMVGTVSYKELSAIFGISDSSVGDIINGKRKYLNY